MLSGPAILRISVLLLVAGVLAALAQYLLPAAPPSPVTEPPAAGSAPASPAPAAEAPQAAGPPQATPQPQPAPRAQSPGQPQSQPQPAPRSEAPQAFQLPRDALAFPDATPSPIRNAAPATATPAPVPAPVPPGEAEVARAEDTAPPRAVALVDLNTASVADLNRLQGGGAIGRSITAKRPYASVDQLLTKRVLSRAVYERIKDQVTVR